MLSMGSSKMSEQVDLQPLYVVTNSYGAYGVSMRAENGSYLSVCKMQMPFDNPAAALKVCEALTVLDVKLKVAVSKKSKPYFVGTNS